MLVYSKTLVFGHRTMAASRFDALECPRGQANPRLVFSPLLLICSVGVICYKYHPCKVRPFTFGVRELTICCVLGYFLSDNRSR